MEWVVPERGHSGGGQEGHEHEQWDLAAVVLGHQRENKPEPLQVPLLPAPNDKPRLTWSKWHPAGSEHLLAGSARQAESLREAVLLLYLVSIGISWWHPCLRVPSQP